MKNKNYDPFPGDINDLVFDSLRKARQARFEHGETPITSNSPLNSKNHQREKLEKADIDNDTLMQAMDLQRQKGKLGNWRETLRKAVPSLQQLKEGDPQ